MRSFFAGVTVRWLYRFGCLASGPAAGAGARARSVNETANDKVVCCNGNFKHKNC